MTGVYELGELGVRPAILADRELGDELKRRYLDPLMDNSDMGQTLIETTRLYLENGMRVEATARAMSSTPTRFATDSDASKRSPAAISRTQPQAGGLVGAREARSTPPPPPIPPDWSRQAVTVVSALLCFRHEHLTPPPTFPAPRGKQGTTRPLSPECERRREGPRRACCGRAAVAGAARRATTALREQRSCGCYSPGAGAAASANGLPSESRRRPPIAGVDDRAAEFVDALECRGQVGDGEVGQ